MPLLIVATLLAATAGCLVVLPSIRLKCLGIASLSASLAMNAYVSFEAAELLKLGSAGPINELAISNLLYAAAVSMVVQGSLFFGLAFVRIVWARKLSETTSVGH